MIQNTMAKKRASKKPDDNAPKRYPSRENTRYAGMPLELFEELELIGEPIERSVSYLTRKAVKQWLLLLPVESLLDNIEPQDLPQLQKCLEEIIRKKQAK